MSAAPTSPTSAVGAFVPIPSRLFVSSQKSFVGSEDKTPAVPAMSTAPLVWAVAVPVPPWATLRGVESEARDVMSLFAPELAAERFVRAPAAVADPMPPCATESGVSSPLIAVMSLFDPLAAADRFARAFAAFTAPVPPFATATVLVTFAAVPVALPVTFPVRFAVIIPAAKLPEPSRLTIALGVFASVAAFARTAPAATTPSVSALLTPTPCTAKCQLDCSPGRAR